MLSEKRGSRGETELCLGKYVTHPPAPVPAPLIPANTANTAKLTAHARQAQVVGTIFGINVTSLKRCRSTSPYPL